VVPVVDLTRRLAAAQPEFQHAVARVLASGQVLLGPETEAFEAEFAAWAGARHAIAVASGASAIQLALSACGVGVGHEVIVPAFTAVPTAAAVCAVGAVPVFADVEPATANIDPLAAAAVMTERTAAIVPVHLYGRPATPARIPHLPVIEDAAQAHGAVPGPRASAAVAYSFYPTKNLGGIGDGGAVCTDDDEVAAQVRRLRLHGMTELYRHVDISQNFRMSEIEAAWLRMQLPRRTWSGSSTIRPTYTTCACSRPSTAIAPAPRLPPPGCTRRCTTPRRSPSNPRMPTSRAAPVRTPPSGQRAACRCPASPS
jgi:dTDP-4-amino-4,6-dideoxygalactose transaminase